MFDPQICQKFKDKNWTVANFARVRFFLPQSLTQKFQHQMVYIWPKFSLQFCSKFLEQNSEVECFALLSLLTKINKIFSKWCLQNLTQEKDLGKTSNLSTLRTTGSDIFFKILTSFRNKNWSTYRYQFLCKTRHQKSAPKSRIFGAIFWCQIWHTFVPNGDQIFN